MQVERKNRMMTKQRSALLWLGLLVFLASLGNAEAQERKILYSKSLSDGLAQAVNVIRNPFQSERIPYAQLARKTNYFVRVAQMRHIFTNHELDEGASLGGNPYVFITTPESIFGRSLFDIYKGIGYDAKYFIGRSQREADMVAIIFRYSDDISVSEITNGQLPREFFRYVYVPSWDNMFSLFSQLIDTGAISMSDAEKTFAMGFPQEGKDRIAKTDYDCLRATGSDDWRYRHLMQVKLSMFAHFQGNGRAHDEVMDPEGENPKAGFLEFVGPNRKIKDLPEVAIIDLGRLFIGDTYSPIRK